MTMRMLFLGLNYAPEEIGIGLYSSEMLQDCAAAGHRVEAVVAQPYYPRWRVFEGYRGGWRQSKEVGVALLRCPLYVPAHPTGLKRILHHLSFAIAGLLPMLKRTRRDRPDLVMTTAPSLLAAPVALLAAKLSGAKSWLHVQDFEVEAAFATGLAKDRGSGARFARAFERRILTAFDVVSTISAPMAAALEAKGVRPERIREFRNWADIEAVRPLEGPSPYRTEWPIGDRRVALYSGNIGRKQGIEIVLEAARLLEGRKDIVFVICGDGPNRAEVERVAAAHENILVRDLQPKARLGELVGLATVHLLPQVAGAADLLLPSKLTNMLASGRPVIATAATGTGLAAEVEGAGAVTAPGDPQALADAITMLVDNPDHAARLGGAARRKAVENWSRSAIMSRFLAQAQELVG